MALPSVLVTGGAKRIGAAISRAFGDTGWHVVVHYGRSREAAEALAASLPSAETIGCDLADEQATEAMAAALAEKHPDWRALINSAAVFELDTHEALDAQVFGRAVQVNVAAPVRLAQAFLSQSRTAGGKRVVNVLDMKLANPNPDFFSYSMSKSALASATRMLAMGAVDDPATRICGLAPGAILPSYDQQPEEIERSHRMNLLARKTQAHELAEAALFLAEGWLASGETLYVDSGQHLLSQPRDVLFLARQ